MQAPNHGGFLLAKDDELSTGQFATIFSEKPGNIGHYEEKYIKEHGDGPIPPAVIMIVVKEEVDADGTKTRYLQQASNMPHTREIFDRILTPYCSKEVVMTGKASVHKRGFGGILPVLYIGGVNYIQWENPDKTYSQMVSDIKYQLKCAQLKEELDKPTYSEKILPKQHRYYNDVELWGSTVIDMFKEHGIVTWETTIDPTFKGHEDLTGNLEHFRHSMEAIQTQFEEAIHDGRLKLIGVFLSSDEPKIFASPYLFHNDNTPSMSQHANAITTSGRYNLQDEFTVECMAETTVEPSTNPSLYVRFLRADDARAFYSSPLDKRRSTTPDEYSYYRWVYAGGFNNYRSEQLVAPVQRFEPDYELTYGRSDVAKQYSDVIRELPTEEQHPLQQDSVEKFADGVYVSMNRLRVSSRPIDGGGKKVANSMDHSAQRIHLNIITERMKAHIHLKDWKEKSEFTNISKPLENPLIFGIHAMRMFQERAFKEGKKAPRTLERFTAILGLAAPAMGGGMAAVEGRNYETRFGQLMQEEFPDMKHILGDQTIKRDVLGLALNSQGNQAVDTLHISDADNLWIAVQVKSGDRDKAEAYNNFVNTYHQLRDRALTTVGYRCVGIVVHYKGLKHAPAYEVISKEAGLSIVSCNSDDLDVFEGRCVERIREILKYY